MLEIKDAGKSMIENYFISSINGEYIPVGSIEYQTKIAKVGGKCVLGAEVRSNSVLPEKWRFQKAFAPGSRKYCYLPNCDERYVPGKNFRMLCSATYFYNDVILGLDKLSSLETLGITEALVGSNLNFYADGRLAADRVGN